MDRVVACIFADWEPIREIIECRGRKSFEESRVHAHQQIFKDLEFLFNRFAGNRRLIKKTYFAYV